MMLALLQELLMPLCSYALLFYILCKFAEFSQWLPIESSLIK